jgi:hypothetical protein
MIGIGGNVRAVCFGRLNVQNHGVPVKLGQSTLSAAATAADETLTMTSATPFCSDMIPFKMELDPSLTTREVVGVKGINGTAFSVQRGLDGTTPSAHGTGAVAMAKFPFAGWELSAVAGLTGKVYWGRSPLTAGGAGTIYELVPNPTASVGSDHRSFMATDGKGNPLNLADYAMDVAVDGEGAFLVVWTV